MPALSYIELCLQALPAEKQAAARLAFRDLIEGAPDDSMLSRLLIVLEATATYGKTIPAEITAAAEKVLPAIDARLAKLAQVSGDEDERRLKQVRDLLEKLLTAMMSAPPVGRNANAIEALRVAVERLERGVRRLRHVRIGAVAALMLLAAAGGVGGMVAYFRDDYNLGPRYRLYYERLCEHGVSAKIGATDGGGLVLRIEGKGILKGTDWRRDEQGNVIGVEIVYP
jgi:hypothetical protein